MLKLKNIYKTYNIENSKKNILENINLEFKNSELVFIVGASGAGKSTLLNIIGGNLKCDRGDIFFNNLCLNRLSEKELDNYRQNIVSTVFQDYNLIEYLDVWDNINLNNNKNKSPIEIDTLLKQLNIYEKKHTIVNKLSGGQKQRVAIARALINDPAIILADEPTGALDSQNSREIMQILEKLAKNRLVIVVTHNVSLARKYSKRIIHIKDGQCKYQRIVSDDTTIKLNRTKNNYGRILKLAITSLKHRPFRTIITALAISLGLTSTIIVTNMYSNFSDELNNLEEQMASLYPITISNGEYELPHTEDPNEVTNMITSNKTIHHNIINKQFITYLNHISAIKSINYNYDILLPIISDNYLMISPTHLEEKQDNNNYQLIYGSTISSPYEVLLKIDNHNNVDDAVLTYFGFDAFVSFEEVIGRKMKVILNDQYFIKKDNYYVNNENNEELYNASNLELTIVGIVQEKEVITGGSTLIYSQELLNEIIETNATSKIVTDLLNNDYKILGFTTDKESLLSYLGYNTLPTRIAIYADNLQDKNTIIQKLDEYNQENDQLLYVDTMSSSIEVVRKFITIVSFILIAFSLIAVIVSSLMIAILTSNRILERTKEIGILKSLGYSKRNIRKLFSTENIIIGIIAFIISIVGTLLIIKPANAIIYHYLAIDNLLKCNYQMLAIIFLANVIIIKIVSIIPTMRASRLETVKCIYGK